MGKLIVIDSDKLEELMNENSKDLKKNLLSIFRKHMIIMLTDVQSEIEEKGIELCDDGWYLTYNQLIQQKIDELKEKNNESY